MAVQSAHLTFAASDPDTPKVLAQLDELLKEYSPKNFTYGMTLRFCKLTFGSGTLPAMPASYTEGRDASCRPCDSPRKPNSFM